MTAAMPVEQRVAADRCVTYQVHCLTEATDLITHLSGTDGNVAKINREAVLTADGIRLAPFISGNALRHRMVRRPIYLHLIREWGLEGSLTKDHLQFLFHGGRNREKTAGRVNMQHTSDLFRLIPAAKLLGCCLPGGIISGGLNVWRGALACKENSDRIRLTAPDGWWEDVDLPSASELVSSAQYVRGTPKMSVPDYASSVNGEADDEEKDSGQMIMRAEGIIPGALFWHGFAAQRVTRVEIGCLMLALRLWQANDQTVGGMGGKGHGRLRMALSVSPGIDQDELIGEYLDCVEANREEGVQFLHGLFSKDSPSNGKPKRKKS